MDLLQKRNENDPHGLIAPKPKNARKWETVALVLTIIALVQQSHSGITPALAEIAKAFPESGSTMMALLNTLPTLTSIPATVLVGRTISKKVSHKRFLLLGMSLLFVGGVLGTVCKTLWQLFLVRAVFGVGLGVAVTSLTDLTLAVYAADRAKKQLALNALSANFGSILFQFLGGYLCMIGWQYTFLCYLIIAVPLIAIAVFLPAQAGQRLTADAAEEAKAECATRIPAMVVVKWCAISALFYAAFYVYVNNMSAIIVNGEMGTTGDVAIVLSVFGLGGMLGSYLYRRFVYRTNQAAFLLALATCMLGYLCVWFAKTLLLLYVSAVVFGCGFGMFVPVLMFYGGTAAGKEHHSHMVSYLNIANYAGGFCSVYIMTGLARLLNITVDRGHFLIALMIFFLLLIGMLYELISAKRKQV